MKPSRWQAQKLFEGYFYNIKSESLKLKAFRDRIRGLGWENQKPGLQSCSALRAVQLIWVVSCTVFTKLGVLCHCCRGECGR